LKNINPLWLPKKIAQKPTQYYIQGIAARNVAVLSAAITLIESTLPAHHQQANQLLQHLPTPTPQTLRIGITGIPGAGKSTFIEALGLHLIAQGRRVAVLAIDPSSTQSGGSILGDKTRMQRLSIHPSAFVRPSATAGNLGGITQRTHQTMLLCEAAGFDTIIIETVGVGQSEIEVSQLTDFFVLLTIAGTGDELQGIKRGIIEMADAIILNKTDSTHTQTIQHTQAMYRNALHLFRAKPSGFQVNTMACSALKTEGIAEVWQMIQQYHTHTTENGYYTQKRQNQLKYWLHRHLKSAILDDFYSNQHIQNLLSQAENELHNHPNDFFEKINILLQVWKMNHNEPPTHQNFT
jgi:LAO/AO transport system kinase